MKPRADLPPIPERMQKLPLDARGYPVPWFVAWVGDQPVFQVADKTKWFRAVREKRCWLCGEHMGVHQAFVVGPMCGINRVTGEPPSHLECAMFALGACPFLTRPAAIRTTRGIPQEILETKSHPGGEMIERNPGVSLLWVTKTWDVFKVKNGRLIRLGAPTMVAFYREGRTATRDEVTASISDGLPLLLDVAEQDGELGVREFWRQVEAFKPILDAAFEGAAK